MASDNEFLIILRIVRHFVQLVLEISFELIVGCLLIVPLCIPWRCCAVLATAVPPGGTWVERRSEFRWRGTGHVIVALTDLVVAPLAVLPLLCPTRMWPVIDLLWHRGEYNNYGKGDDADDLCSTIQYDFKLRICLVANCFGAIADLPALAVGCIAVCHPWRTVEILSGSSQIIGEVPPWNGYRHTFSMPYGSMNLGKSLKEFWESSTKFSTSDHKWKSLEEEERPRKRIDPLGPLRRLIRHVAGQPFSGRWSGSLSEFRRWCFIHGMECILDWVCLVMGLLSLVLPTRVIPLLREVTYLWHIEWPLWGFTIFTTQHNIQRFPWRRLHGLLAYNLGYALTDAFSMLCSAFIAVTCVRTFPLAFDIWLDWPNSPKQVSVDLTQYQGVLDLGPNVQPTDLSGTYTRRGKFGSSRCYERIASSEGEVPGIGFMGFWDDWWHLCPLAVTSTAVVRFRASAVVAGHSPVSNSQPGSWQVRSDSEDTRWKVVAGELSVTEVKDGVHTTWFGELGYNMELRLHTFKHAFLFFIDLLFCPFLVGVLLTAYRIPPLLVQMRKDVEDHRIKRGADAWHCCRIRFGWHSRKEVVRQMALIVCDVAILPLLIILRISCYRFPDPNKFDYFDASFHKLVVMNVVVLIFDTVLIMPATLVALTYYRLKYVVSSRRKYESLPIDQPSSPVNRSKDVDRVVFSKRSAQEDSKSSNDQHNHPIKNELLRDENIADDDLLNDSGLFLSSEDVQMNEAIARSLAPHSDHQASNLRQVFGRSATSHLESQVDSPTRIRIDEANDLFDTEENLLAEHDSQANGSSSKLRAAAGGKNSKDLDSQPFLDIPKKDELEVQPTESLPDKSKSVRPRSRLGKIIDKLEMNWSTRKEIMRQGSLVVCDVAFSPVIVFVYLTRYRWEKVAKRFSPYDAEMHKSAFLNSLIILCDLFILVPCLLMILISIRRTPPIIDVVLDRPARVGSANYQDPNSEDQVEGMEGWDGRIRQEVLFQCCAGLFDLIYLPHLLLVLITRYRAKHVDLFELTDDYHERVQEQAKVVLIDIFFYGPMLLIISLSVYRSWPLFRVLQQTMRVCCACCCKGRRGRRRHGHVQLAESEEQIMRNMVIDNPEWGDMLDWNGMVPLDEENRDMRKVIAHEFLGFLMDIPFFPIAVLLLLTFWRVPVVLEKSRDQPRARQRRCLLVRHMVLTLRDFLLTPLFVILLVTPRCAKLLAQLCARKNRTLQGAPRFQILGAEVVIVEQGRPTVSFDVQCTQGTGQLTKGSLKIQLAGSGFWRTLRETFGSFITSVVQSILPMQLHNMDTNIYEKLSGQMPVEAGQRMTFSVKVPMKVKQQAIARGVEKLAADEWVLLQLEGKDAFSWRRFVLCAAAMQVRTLEKLAKQAGGQISKSDLGDADLVRLCQAGQHLGIVESFGPLVLNEFRQLIIDIGHLLLVALLAVAPWRLIECFCRLVEPVSWWPCRACAEVIACVEELDVVLSEIRNEFVPLCNSVAKLRVFACHWCNQEGLEFAPPQIMSFRSHASLEHQALMHLLHCFNRAVPESVSQQVHSWLEMHDAHLYYTALKSYVHCLISAGRIGPELHGVITESVDNAEVSFGEAKAKSRRDTQTEVDSCWAKARSQACCSCAILDFDTTRSIVQTMVRAALFDVIGIIAFLLVLVTFYRVPRLFADLKRSGAWLPTTSKFKSLSLRHAVGLCIDLELGVEITVLFLLLLITLVRFPEAFEDAVSQRHTLVSLRKLLVFNLRAAVDMLWDIFSLLGLVKNYIFMSRTVLQSCLVPPACLSELLGRICPCFRLEIRFVASAIVFYGLAFSSFWWEFIDPSVQAATRIRFSLVLMLVILVGNFLSMQRHDSFRSISSDDWAPTTMRITWCNALSMAVVVMQPAILCSWIWSQWDLLEEDNSVRFLFFLNDWVQSHLGLLQWFGVFSAISFLLLVSGAFVSADESRAVLRSPIFRVSQLLLSHALFLPTIGCLLMPAFLQGEDDGGQRWSVALLCAYLVTTQIFSSESGLMDALPKECGIDMRYPAVYIIGIQLGDLLIIVLPLLIDHKGLRLAAALATMLVMTTWSLFYERIHGCPPCCVPHVTKLRIGGSIALAWTIACSLSGWASAGVLLSGLVLIVGATLLVACFVRVHTARGCYRLMEDTGIHAQVKQLIDAEDTLCVQVEAAASKVGRKKCRYQRWSDELKSAVTAKSVAFILLDFEDHILAERLDIDFLERRNEWRSELPTVQDFPEVISLVNELQQSLRTPSTLPALLSTATQLLRRHDLAPDLVDYLVGHRALCDLMEAALFAIPSAAASSILQQDAAGEAAAGSTLPSAIGSFSFGVPGVINMATHCHFARNAIEDVLENFGLRPEDSPAFELWKSNLSQVSSDSESDSGTGSSHSSTYLNRRSKRLLYKTVGWGMLMHIVLVWLFVDPKSSDPFDHNTIVGPPTAATAIAYLSGCISLMQFAFALLGCFFGLSSGYFFIYWHHSKSFITGVLLSVSAVVVFIVYLFLGFVVGSVVWCARCCLARRQQTSERPKTDVRVYDRYGNIWTSRPAHVKIAGKALRLLPQSQLDPPS